MGAAQVLRIDMSLTDGYQPPAGNVNSTPPAAPGQPNRANVRPRIDTRYVLSQMRVASGMSPVELAAELGTTATVIRAIENRDYASLPIWPEVSRVLYGFGQLLDLDISPLIHQYQYDLAIARQTHTSGLAPWHPVGASVPTPNKPVVVMPKALRTPSRSEMRRARRREKFVTAGKLAASTTLVAGLAAGIWLLAPLAAQKFQADQSAGLPKVVEHKPSLFEAFKLPKREDTGVRWLSLSDPANRKSSRLPSTNK